MFSFMWMSDFAFVVRRGFRVDWFLGSFFGLLKGSGWKFGWVDFFFGVECGCICVCVLRVFIEV